MVQYVAKKNRSVPRPPKWNANLPNFQPSIFLLTNYLVVTRLSILYQHFFQAGDSSGIIVPWFTGLGPYAGDRHDV